MTGDTTPQPTDRNIRSTSSTHAILPVFFLSSQQDYTQSSVPVPENLIQSTQPTVGSMTRGDISESDPLILFIVFGRTRWRLINSLFLLTVGTAKSISAYRNASAAANSLDLVIGILWALM